MNFAILINSAPYTSQASQSAYLFANAIIAKKYQIQQVFFYLDGVYHANKFIYSPTDEMQLISAWDTLAKQGQFELVICSSAALKRGVINEDLAQQYGKTDVNFNQSFKMASLTQLLDAACKADRFIIFGD